FKGDPSALLRIGGLLYTYQGPLSGLVPVPYSQVWAKSVRRKLRSRIHHFPLSRGPLKGDTYCTSHTSSHKTRQPDTNTQNFPNYHTQLVIAALLSQLILSRRLIVNQPHSATESSFLGLDEAFSPPRDGKTTARN
ncbi:unnamed protein product, partial [Laminaria digitata]